DQALVGELLVVRPDRVGEAALLAHLAEETRGGRAAEDRVENCERVTALVVTAQPRGAEADVVLLGLLPAEAEPGASVERHVGLVAAGAGRVDQLLGESDDAVVIEV